MGLSEKTQVSITLASTIIILISLFGFSWNTSKKVNQIENDILTNSTLIDVNACDIADTNLLVRENANKDIALEISVAEINTNLKYIMLGIEELKEDRNIK